MKRHETHTTQPQTQEELKPSPAHSYTRMSFYITSFLLLLASTLTPLSLTNCFLVEQTRACRVKIVDGGDNSAKTGYSSACGAYLCNKESVLCFNSCTGDGSSQCNTKLGYTCKEGKCTCDRENEKAYCTKQCFVETDCLQYVFCQGNNNTNLCQCSDPCSAEGAEKTFCLDTKLGSTPEGYPKICIKTQQQTDAGTTESGETEFGETETIEEDAGTETETTEEDAGTGTETTEESTKDGGWSD